MTSFPSGLNYFNEFITKEKELGLIKFIDSQIWNTSLKRRTQHYGHLYQYTYGRSQENTTAPPIPDVLLSLYERIILIGVTVPIELKNLQVIVNE